MTEMVAVYFGSVNRWECDENDHLNVRFYCQKMHQTLIAGLEDLNLRSSEDTGSPRLISQHMRFVAEARIAAPLTGLIGLLEVNPQDFTVLTELRNTQTGQVQAAFIQRIQGMLTLDHPCVALPDYARSRGLDPVTSPYADLTLTDAREAGFNTIGRGVVQADECDQNGHLLNHLYMGRVSDSMPNLWARFDGPTSTPSRGDASEGGAVVEYRMTFHHPLRLGERFEVVSGVRALGDKTQHIAHQIYSLDSGHCVVTADAVAVTMDLIARRAISINPTRRTAMRQFLLAAPAAI
jgi:acyl-CoA thioester hydrolase